MKCPHCGIEIRDTMTVCMYCGGKIPQRKGAAPAVSGKVPDSVTRSASKTAATKAPADGEGETGDEEEEGGLSAYLQPGEQVLIGSLNVTVKKFYFHAYLTDRRIFLIDTQEKKLKVTAKDIPRDTITDTSVELSESSDPVLVLSIRAADDEIKTMKLVFVGNGLDRSGEVDEWVELLNEQGQPKKKKKPAAAPNRPEPEPEEPSEEPAVEDEWEEDARPVRAPRAAPRQELRPARRPVKDHEKQPPVKRLLSLYKTEPEAGDTVHDTLPETAREIPPAAPARKGAPRQAPYREIPPVREPAAKPVRKVEVQSAMKGAMKGAMEPVAGSPEKPAHRPAAPAARKPVIPEPEPVFAPGQPDEDEFSSADPAYDDASAAAPLFCQNCGKKLPAAANFCPGCGTKISVHRENSVHKEKPGPKVREKSSRSRHEEPEEAADAEPPRPAAKPVIRKAPKGSEMTILHKFLRR